MDCPTCAGAALHTFIVLALLILILSPVVILRTPTDIFPNINIPVIAAAFNYTGLSAEEMEERITSIYERSLTTTVNDIEHIESQSIDGRAIIKVFFQPGADINAAVAQVSAISQPILRQLPPGASPPFLLTYNASSVPILQLGLAGSGLSEQALFDYGVNFIRTRLVTIPGCSIPYPYGGKQRQVMVDIDPAAMQSKGLSPADVTNAIGNQNLIIPAGTSKIGQFEYDVDLNSSPATVEAFNDFPVKVVNGAPVYIRDIGHVRDGYAPQTNIVRQDGNRAVLLTVMKGGNASTLSVVDGVRRLLPVVSATLPPELKIQPLADQSIFVRASISGVIREAVIAACLTGLMILLFLGSWRSTLIIAISIPLSILTSILVLSFLHETINIMTLGGMALAVGILVDDATVEIENVNRNLDQGKEIEQAILDGASQIAVPALVSTFCICIVFLPMFFLSGVALLSVRNCRWPGESCSVRHAGLLWTSRGRWSPHWLSISSGCSIMGPRETRWCCSKEDSNAVSMLSEKAIGASWRYWFTGESSSCRSSCWFAFRSFCFTRGSARISFRLRTPANSSCTCVPRPAPASKRRRASAT